MDKAPHEKGSHPNAAEHAAKGLIYYALKADGTWSQHTSRAEANAAAGEGGVVAKRNPHLTAEAQAAEDSKEAAAAAV